MKKNGKKKFSPAKYLDPDEVLADSFGPTAHGDLAEGKMERPIGKFTLYTFLLLVFISVLYLTSRAASLQIENGKSFLAQSEKNRFAVRWIFPPRGIMYDLNGTPLVENTLSYGVLFDKKEFSKGDKKISQVLLALAAILGKTSDYFYALGFPAGDNLSNMPPQIDIDDNIPQDEVLKISAELDNLPGIQIFESYNRAYYDPLAMSHVLGYVGKVSTIDIASNPNLYPEEKIGKNGLENYYDSILRGSKGEKLLEVDALGHQTNYTLVAPANSGDSLGLTLDAKLQSYAYQDLAKFAGASKGGSIVAIDPRNGKILALVSYPGFDINKFSSGISTTDFQNILDNLAHPLFNRAISGVFPPGSAIKPVLACAVLENNIINPDKKIYDPGYLNIPNPYNPGQVTVYKDWRPQGYVDLYDAIAQSADVYFYIVGGGYQNQQGLGIKKIQDILNSFGFGTKLGIDLPSEQAGSVPGPNTKNDNGDSVWRVGDTYNVSIGQGGLLASPLQIADATAAIANGGTLWRPYLVAKIIKPDGSTEEIKPQAIKENVVSSKAVTEVVKGMEWTVNSPLGTARFLRNMGIQVAAKTGTAQAGGGAPHSWITAFAPAENPQIVLVTMIEHGGDGAVLTAPLTKDILSWYFSNHPEIK